MPFTTYSMLSTRDIFDSDTQKLKVKELKKKKKKPRHLGSDRGDRYDYTNQMKLDILNKN